MSILSDISSFSSTSRVYASLCTKLQVVVESADTRTEKSSFNGEFHKEFTGRVLIFHSFRLTSPGCESHGRIGPAAHLAACICENRIYDDGS